MGDLFGEGVNPPWIAEILSICADTPQHTYLLLTKSPEWYDRFEIPENCWLGTSITGIWDADEHKRVWDLNSHKVKKTFISVEPLLDGNFRAWPSDNWIIVGAQTGPGAVKPDSRWVDQIIKDCRQLGIPLFLKDNLNWHMKIQEYPK
jgi:protein gp37